MKKILCLLLIVSTCLFARGFRSRRGGNYLSKTVSLSAGTYRIIITTRPVVRVGAIVNAEVVVKYDGRLDIILNNVYGD